eukprot:1037137-Prorocentrum_minimum.AAC.5
MLEAARLLRLEPQHIHALEEQEVLRPHPHLATYSPRSKHRSNRDYPRSHPEIDLTKRYPHTWRNQTLHTLPHSHPHPIGTTKRAPRQHVFVAGVPTRISRPPYHPRLAPCRHHVLSPSALYSVGFCRRHVAGALPPRPLPPAGAAHCSSPLAAGFPSVEPPSSWGLRVRHQRGGRRLR